MEKIITSSMPKHLVIILKEMCKRVGADYEKVYFMEDWWYAEYQWTKEEQDDFSKWMVDYLYKNSDARKEIMAFPRKSEKDIKKAVNFFLLSFGWKFKS